MKKIIVNESACIGCGACVALDSEHFDFNDSGLSHTISNENIENENVQAAIDSCPTSAICIMEVAEEENQTCDCSGQCTCGDNCECTSENKCNEDCTCGDTCECGDNCHCDESCPNDKE